MKYFKRISDELLERKLRSSGAVLIEGAKWCGKTSTGLQAAQSVFYLQDPDKRITYKKMADIQPSLLLKGDAPILLDEWQTIPVLWDAVRFAVDQRQSVGQFILTGSATPLRDNQSGEIEHTGTGRISRMLMRPMSLWESHHSTGEISLQALFDQDQKEIFAENPLTIEDLSYQICAGGWPGNLFLNREDALETAYNYVDELIQWDIHKVDGTEKNPDRIRSVLRSYARNVSTMTSATTIMNDVRANDISITDKTLTAYLTALRRLFVIEDVKAWKPSLRSKSAIRTSNKCHFVDPSIAVAALELNPSSLLSDFNLFGYLFEDLCVRDMRVYSQPLRGEVFHYHDSSNLESDMIIRLNDGRWAAVEVKLGGKEEEIAAKNLQKLVEILDASQTCQPSFLMILTGGQYAYRRPDGIYVVPIGCIKP